MPETTKILIYPDGSWGAFVAIVRAGGLGDAADRFLREYLTRRSLMALTLSAQGQRVTCNEGYVVHLPEDYDRIDQRAFIGWTVEALATKDGYEVIKVKPIDCALGGD